MEEEKTSLHVDLVKCRQQLCETTQMKASLEKLRAENADLRAGADAARAEGELLRAETAEQRSANERLTIELGKVRQEASTAAAAASRDKEALMSEIAALSEKHLKVNAELESTRSEKTTKTELAAQLGTQLAALLAKTKETALERENQERQITVLRNELAGKVAQIDKLTKDQRSTGAHADNLKKQVSKLLLAVAEKEKHLAALHSDNQKLRGDNQAYGDKLAGQDALINRIAQLEQDIANRNVTISKVCAEREDGVRQLEQLRARHAVTLREIQEARETREIESQAAARQAIEQAAEQANLTEKLTKASEELDQLKKSHDIALSERTIAESRCRSTLNLSRKLEKEVVMLQKDKERMTNELAEIQQHVTYLKNERTELLQTFKDLPERMQKLQTENGILRNDVEKLRDREHAWAPLVQAGLARGRKQPNANVMSGATTTPAAVGPKSDTIAAPPSSAPQPKKKTIFARLKDSTSDKVTGGDQLPVKSKIAIFEEKVASSGGNAQLTSSTTTATTSVASSAAVPATATPAGGLGQRRRGVRRSASDTDFSNAAAPPVKKGNADSNRKDNITTAAAAGKEVSETSGSTPGSGRREANSRNAIAALAQATQQQLHPTVAPTTPKGRAKISSSTEEDDEDERISLIPAPAPMISRRRSQQSASKAPTPPKSRGSQMLSNVKSRSNAVSNNGTRGRGVSNEKNTQAKDSLTPAITAPSSRSGSAAKALLEGEYPGQQPKGRRSLVKGTPKKTPAGVAAALGRLGTPGQDNQTTGGSNEGAVGRSLRASTLVVKKASDIDAKQREQFKHKGRPSAGSLSTDM
ncbi:hypothetical protein BIW11_05747 [Tropilaelaps mercedesae]|uniref:Uncharacterized protein n=1 Tax=Tropilaelaps mercedesae TaxID=418985 RepID=A0A1V9Y107_9ACAR|nr:hypothetical protein BIW11_05747 [Tropilaelaps mercedesae]